MFPHFQKYLNPKVRINKLVNIVFSCFLLSFKISLRDAFFHIYINSWGFYLSRMLVDFLWLVYSGKIFQFMEFTFRENALNLCIFTHAPLVPHSKVQVGFFENLFPPRRNGWKKLWFALSKVNQKIRRWLGKLVYLHFVWFVIFLNVMALQFCK